MRRLALFIHVWLMHLAAATNHNILVPHHRHFWDPTVPNPWDGNCTDITANVTLQDQELLQWTSTNDTEGAAYVSLRMWPQDGKKIIDMEKFSYQLESATCAGTFSLRFQNEASFQAAESAWSAVNSDEQHLFFLVADTVKCANEERIPWLITAATFDREARTISLQAAEKEWAEVIQSYILDLGNVDSTSQKRAVLVDEAFVVPLDLSWPTELLKAPENPYFKLKASCFECGTKGSLVFAAHVEGEILKGITQALFSATPRDIEGNIQVEVEFDGQYHFMGTEDFASESFDLGRIPIPIPGATWAIPGVFTFGPNVLVKAGYDLESIDAQGTISTGATASVPAGSILSVDLISKEFRRDGWIPEFTTHPLECNAEVNVKGHLWAGVAPSASLLVFPGKKAGIVNLEKGISLDLELRFLELTIDATGGYNAQGFCPNNPAPFGVNIDMWLGSSLTISGWESLSGTRNDLLNQVLFENDKLYHIPPVCLSFGTGNAGSCDAVLEDEEDREWWENEVANPVDVSLRRMERMRRHQILPRDYYLACDKRTKNWPIKLHDYPNGQSLIGAAKTKPPIIYPWVPCSEGDKTTCAPDRWMVEVLKVSVKANQALIGTKNWNAEHVYEGNWVRDFWNELAKTKYLGTCQQVNDIFKIQRGGGYADEMLSELGTVVTFQERMTLLPHKENLIKHLMFALKYMDGKFKSSKDQSGLPNTAIKRACSLGRIVGVCKYMEMDETKEILKDTLMHLHDVLVKMDKNDAALKEARKLNPDFQGFALAHQTWFTGFYKAGVNNARDKLQEYAKWMIKKTLTEYEALGEDLEIAIEKLANGDSWDEYCPYNFNYPVQAEPAKKPDTSCPADTTSDPNNCGECGKECPSDQVCTNSECTVPPSAEFPPKITPANGPLGGWQFSADPPSGYLANSESLKKDSFLSYDGKLTVNTGCMPVYAPPNNPIDTITKDTTFNFASLPLEYGEVADTCCIAFFRGTTCTIGTGEPQRACFKDNPIGSGIMELDAKSWQVYGCIGLWIKT